MGDKVIVIGFKFWNRNFRTPEFFKNIEKLLQYKKFLLYVHKDQSYSTKHEKFSQKWQEKLLGKINSASECKILHF